MKHTHPPAIAAWMLEHLTAGFCNDTLAGDLCEELQRGRSTVWYWRQVLTAIAVGIPQRARALWLMLLYAALWSIPAPALQFYSSRSPEMNRLFGDIVQLDWPWSALGTLAFENGLGLLLVWTGLIVYLWLHFHRTRTLSRTRLWQGMLTSLPVLVAVSAALASLPLRQSFDVRHVTAMSFILNPLFVLARLPFFFSLLLSIWAALPPSRRTFSRAA